MQLFEEVLIVRERHLTQFALCPDSTSMNREIYGQNALSNTNHQLMHQVTLVGSHGLILDIASINMPVQS